MIKGGVHPDLPDKNGLTAMILAGREGREELVDLLYNKFGANLNQQCFRYMRTALIESATRGCIRSYDCLVECGADVNLRDKEFLTAKDYVQKAAKIDDSVDIREGIVLIAAATARFEEIQYAMEVGIDVHTENLEGRDCIKEAIFHENYHIANAILGQTFKDVPRQVFDAWFNGAKHGNVKQLQWAVEQGLHVDLPTKCGRTALMTASAKAYKAVIDMLMKLGANADVVDNDGKTALIIASLTGRVATVEQLLQFEVDINIQDRSGNTALHLSLKKNKMQVSKVLMKTGMCDFNLQNNAGETALMLAINTASAVAVEYMLKNGASWRPVDDLGRAALSIALLRDNAKMVQTLAHYGAELNQDEIEDLQDRWFNAIEENNFATVGCMLQAKYNANSRSSNDMCTGVISAAKHDHVQIIEQLRVAGADLDCTDENGFTALHWACKLGHKPTVALLLEQSNTVNNKAQDGSTPLSLAKVNLHSEIVGMLLQLSSQSTYSFE